HTQDKTADDDRAGEPAAADLVRPGTIESPADQPLEDLSLHSRQVLVELVFQIGELHLVAAAGKDPAEHLLLVGLERRCPRRLEPVKNVLPPLDQPQQRTLVLFL